MLPQHYFGLLKLFTNRAQGAYRLGISFVSCKQGAWKKKKNQKHRASDHHVKQSKSSNGRQQKYMVHSIT